MSNYESALDLLRDALRLEPESKLTQKQLDETLTAMRREDAQAPMTSLEQWKLVFNRIGGSCRLSVAHTLASVTATAITHTAPMFLFSCHHQHRSS